MNKRSLSGVELANVILDVEDLARFAHTYRQLFGTERGVRAVNSVARDTFNVLLHSLKQVMTVGVARTILDPPMSRGRENLGLHTLIHFTQQEDDPLVARLEALRARLELQGLTLIRHKLTAHRDYETIMALAAGRDHVIPPMKDTDLLDAIDEIVEVLDEYFKRDGGSFSPSCNADVEELISVLNESLDAAA